jgi:hypothetical protein
MDPLTNVSAGNDKERFHVRIGIEIAVVSSYRGKIADDGSLRASDEAVTWLRSQV